jgi:peptidase C25-like protein
VSSTIFVIPSRRAVAGLCFAAVLLLSPVSSAWAAVTVQSTAKTSANSVATATIAAFNPGGASNRVLVVGLTFGQGAPTGVAVNYGGVSLTLAAGTSVTSGNAHTEIWYLADPSNTPAGIVATWSGSHDVVMGAVAFNGADQTTPVVNGITANNATTAVSVTITSAAGDMTMNTVGSLSVTSPFLSAPTKTQQWLDTTPTTVKGGGSTAAGAATVTHGWTAGSAAAWTSSGVDIKAAVIGYEVGTFIKTTAAAAATQVIPHGLGQTPKAIILWTQSRGDEKFSTAPGITFRAAASAGAASGVLTLTISKPAGTAQNDVMVASIAVRPNTATITAPAGWTLIRRTNQAATTANSMATYYRTAGAAEAASYAWTLSASTGSAGGILSFDGVDPSTPVDVENGQITASALTHAAPSVTTTIANDMVVTAHTMTSLITWTPPAGMTEGVDVSSDVPPGNGQSLEMNYVAQPAIAATGVKTATASGDADAGNTETVTLRPAPVFEADFAFGFSDGTTDGSGSSASQNGVGTSNVARRMANKVITIVSASQTLLAEADMQSWNATSFTLNWTTNDADPSIIHYLLVGGSDVSAKVVRWQMATATGNHAVTGVGFQPTAVIHLHTGSGFTATPPANAANSGFGLGVMDFGGAQWATEMFAADAATAGDTQRAQTTAAAIYTIDNGLGVTKKASFVSMDADGFTVNFSTANALVSQVYSLALKGINVKAGNFLKTTAAAPVNQSVIGTGFAPSAVFFHSFQDVTQAAPVTNSRMSYGASDGVTEGSSAFSDLDKADPTNFQAIDKTSKAFMKVNNSAKVVDAEADLTSLDPDGFTVRWTTNDAVATEILYLGLANLENTEVRLVSFDAARYPRGVLVQWRTGYEIDNLGFNLYREINGVRTRVNTTLIAGSGLQAGQGGVVTAEHAYARWDLDAVAADATVTYWLEDVEFDGRTTSHGPVTPAVGELQETPADSAELGDIGNAADSRRIFFNYSDDPVQPGARAIAPHVAPEVARQWALAAEATVKVGVRKRGWYRVTQPELVTAGLDPSIDPRTLKLFVDGTEQAIRVTGETDGVFDAADAIEFYASGVETPYTDARVYWVEAGGPAGRRIAVAVRGASVPSTVTGFSSTLRRKDRSVYFASLKNGDAENWFGPMVVPVPAGPDDPPLTALALTAHHIDRIAAGPAQLNVALQGVASFADGSAGHRVGVLVNDTKVGEMLFAAEAHAEETFAVPVEALIDGENTVTVVALGGGGDSSLVDTLRLDYPHTYQADADRLRFTVAAPASITVAGFAGSSIRVFDITDRTAPVELPATIASDAGLSSAAVDVPGTGARTLLAFSDETVGSPAFVQANHPSSWHAASQAHDYVVISHADFVTQAEPLAELRTQQGHTAAIVDVDDVYDEFSFGEKTPQAMKDFLQWARQTWRQAPRFVVLLGDATIDPRDYAGLGAADFVPTKQVPMSAVALETASDDWFVDFDDNGLPDVPIGRLSVRTPDQAAAVVAKIVNYEHDTAHVWTKDVLLVSGESDGTSNFGQFSSALGALVPHDYAVHQVLSDGLTSDAARQAVVDRVNDGQLIVNYAGHGSVNFWGSSGDLMTNGDVTASWRNDARLPFVVAMNCLNGLFNQIWDEESLAEALQRAPQGGAIAVWASSSVTPPATQALVNQELFRLIFQGTYATLGEAVASAKRVVTNPDLRKSWIFFGDPAMRLNGAPQPASRQTPWTPPPAPIDPPDNSTPGARTISVAAGGDLQAAIDAAAAGDTIQLQAGKTFVGNFVLPVKSGAAYVTIRTATPDALLPRSAARIGPAQAPLLAMIRSPNARAALTTQPGAHHYRLLFLEFGPNARGAGDIIQLGDGSAAQSALARVPHDLQIDRCYIHGDATFGQQRGISLNSATTSITNSYVADIKAVDVSAQAISGWNGPGPYTIVNNYLEAAGQNVLLGGAGASIPSLAPSDVTMRLNYLNKPLQWRSQHWLIKNLLELNNAARVFIDGNVFEENGNGAQEGAAVLLMPRVPDGTAPARIEHVQFTNNIVRHVPAAIDMLDPNGTATDIVVRNNLFADLSSASGGPGRFLLISGGLDITIDHNTVLQDGSAAVYAYGTPPIGFAFTNNILPDNGRAVAGDGSTAGNGTIDRYFPGAVWLHNVVAAAPAAGYPGGNFYPASMAAVGFVDLAGGNYRLAATSAYRNAATDGSNPGYDADALAATVPPSLLMCPVVPSVASPAGRPIAVAVSSPILVAGAAPAGILCATPAGSMFPVGSTTVACATVDLLARIAWCPTTVTVLPPSAPGNGPGSSASPGPPLGSAAVPRAAAPIADRAAEPLATSVAIAATPPDQPIPPTEGSFPSPDLRTSTVAPVADVSATYAPLTTEMFAILGMSGAARSDVPQPPLATTASESPWSEPVEPPSRTQGAMRKGPAIDHVELTSDAASPGIAGTTITVTAKATGGVGPHQYQWSVFDGLTWSLPTAWTEIATFMWTPAAAIADLGIKVGVRSTGNSDETPEAHGTIRFVIVNAAAPAQAPAAVKPPRVAHRPASPIADNHFRAPATIRPRYSHAIGADEPGA